MACDKSFAQWKHIVFCLAKKATNRILLIHMSFDPITVDFVEQTNDVFFVQLSITSVSVSIENIFSPKSSISSALNKGWSRTRAGPAHLSQSAFGKIKFPTKI